MADFPEIKYAAFISYCHSNPADLKFAAWFQRALENYRTPRGLVNTSGLFGPVKRGIGQVFRDVQDLSATPDLASALRNAIDVSAALIVICSPEAAASPWINREISYFKQAHPDRPILAVILRGTRNSRDEPFPEPLRQHFDGVGPFAPGQTAEPLAPDVQREDRATVKLRILAALLGVSFDALFRRERRRLRDRIAIAAIAASVIIAVLLSTTIFALISRQQALAQAYANAAYSYSDRDPTLALRLAQGAMAIRSNDAARVAALRAFNLGSWFYSKRIDGAWDAALSVDETKLAWIKGGSEIHVYDLHTDEEKFWQSDSTYITFTSVGGLVAWKPWSGQGTKGSVTIWNPDGTLKKEFGYEFITAVECGNDKLVVPAFVETDNFSSDPKQIVLHVVDVLSGADGSLTLSGAGQNSGLSGWNLSIRLACSRGADLVVVVQPLLSVGAVIRQDGPAMTFALPADYLPEDIDISSDAKHAAIYLRGSRVGVPDSVGILDLANGSTPALRIVTLVEAPTQDASGLVRFIAGDSVLAASTEGWNRVVDVNTQAVTTLPSKDRAADVISLDPSTGGFAIARRSGSVTVYDSAHFPISKLVGNPPSDGLNVAFRKLTFSASGTHLLTIARDGARLWNRPAFPLVAAVPLTKTLESGPPSAFSNEFGTVSGGGGTFGLKACIDPMGFEVDMTIDDSGSMALCFTWSGGQDSLLTNLTKGEFTPIVSKKVDATDGISFWSGDEYTRMFALEPDRIFKFVESTKEIWKPDSDQLSRFVAR
jgi:hypothetical protein